MAIPSEPCIVWRNELMAEIRPKMKALVMHPFLFAVFPILFLFYHNIGEVDPGVVLVPALMSLAVAATVFGAVVLVLKDARKAGFITSLLLVMFFSYGHVHTALGRIDPYLFRHRYLTVAFAALFVGLSYLVARSGRDLKNATSLTNAVAVILVGISVFNIGAYEFETLTGGSAQAKGAGPPSAIGTVPKGKPVSNAETVDYKPDIYYIIFDRYASARALKEGLGFDNSATIDYLKRKGFKIADNSQANYPATYLSLATSLNMRYMDGLRKQAKNPNDRTPAYRMIQNNKVARLLKSRGYKYVLVGSWWEVTKTSPLANVNPKYSALKTNEFTRKLAGTTVLSAALSQAKLTERDIKRNSTAYQLRKLREVPSVPGPKFVFAHVIMPHAPYVFGPNGEYVSREVAGKRGEKVNFINQVKFANQQIRILVDTILAKSKQPPIIILQADEGAMKPESMRFDFRQLPADRLRLALGILNAYYLPGRPKGPVYKSITPVNSFRYIFRHYFGMDMGMLPDREFIFQDMSHVYQFVEVTKKVAYGGQSETTGAAGAGIPGFLGSGGSSGGSSGLNAP